MTGTMTNRSSGSTLFNMRINTPPLHAGFSIFLITLLCLTTVACEDKKEAGYGVDATVTRGADEALDEEESSP